MAPPAAGAPQAEPPGRGSLAAGSRRARRCACPAPPGEPLLTRSLHLAALPLQLPECLSAPRASCAIQGAPMLPPAPLPGLTRQAHESEACEPLFGKTVTKYVRLEYSVSHSLAQSERQASTRLIGAARFMSGAKVDCSLAVRKRGAGLLRLPAPLSQRCA